MIERKDFVQDDFADSQEWGEVTKIANSLESLLSNDVAQDAIQFANQPGKSSALVQATFLKEAQILGFEDESKGLFSSYQSLLRPDYFRRVGKSGIILEVERGKTTINNMDLLDFWKCHICEYADYLFLLVPRELRQNETMKPKKEYPYVVKRLETFFEPRNYTNVRGLVLFGY